MKKKPFNLREALSNQGAQLDENQLRFVDAFSTALDSRLESEKEDYSDSMTEALRSALGELPKGEDGKVETIASQIRSVAEQLDKIEKRSMKQVSENEKFQLRQMLIDKKDEIVAAFRTGQEFGLEFKQRAAAVPHYDTNTVTGVMAMPVVENFEYSNEIATIRYPENFILNIIRSTQVAKVPQTMIWREQAATDGAVAVVAEGGTKPLIKFNFVRASVGRKKYAGRIEWSEEFEYDNEKLFNAILAMFEDQVVRAWNAGIVADMIANATAYTTSILDDTLVNPDAGIAAIAAASVINAMNFNADTVIMNPADMVATMFTQDVDGNWRLVPYLQGGKINGMNLITSNSVTQGKALIGDSSTYSEEHSAFILRFGVYDKQFITNEKTAVGEVFSILKRAVIDAPSWMYIDLAAVKASLLKP